MNTTETNDPNPWRPLEPGEIIMDEDEYMGDHAQNPEYRPACWERIRNSKGITCDHQSLSTLIFRTRRPRPAPTPEYKCDMRTKLVGDGCAVCNPERYAEYCAPQDSAPAAPSEPYTGGKSTWRVKIDDGFVEYEYSIDSPNGNHSIYELYLAICETLEARPNAAEGNFIRYTRQNGSGEGAGGGDRQTAREWVDQRRYLFGAQTLPLAQELAARADRAEAEVQRLKGLFAVDNVLQLLQERDRAEARVLELESEIESHSWEISPAMAQAKIDQLNERVEELEAREKAIINFCETEMGWMYFRAEFGISKTPTQTEQNANKLRDYLKQHGGLPATPPPPPPSKEDVG